MSAQRNHRLLSIWIEWCVDGWHVILPNQQNLHHRFYANNFHVKLKIYVKFTVWIVHWDALKATINRKLLCFFSYFFLRILCDHVSYLLIIFSLLYNIMMADWRHWSKHDPISKIYEIEMKFCEWKKNWQNQSILLKLKNKCFQCTVNNNERLFL